MIRLPQTADDVRLAITTTAIPATGTQAARIRAQARPDDPTITTDFASADFYAHRSAALLLASRLGWRDTAAEWIGGQLDNTERKWVWVLVPNPPRRPTDPS